MSEIIKDCIFISYRRKDTASTSGRLYSELIKDNFYAGAEVFKDIKDIRAGKDFRTVLTERLGHAHIVLVLIGDRFLELNDESGKPRIFDPKDYFNMEISTSLSDPKKLVIPILVEGAKMPSEEELPSNIRALKYRNALELSSKNWDANFDKIVRELEYYLLKNKIKDRSFLQVADKAVKSDAKAKKSLASKVTLGVSLSLFLVACMVICYLLCNDTEDPIVTDNSDFSSINVDESISNLGEVKTKSNLQQKSAAAQNTPPPNKVQKSKINTLNGTWSLISINSSDKQIEFAFQELLKLGEIVYNFDVSSGLFEQYTNNILDLSSPFSFDANNIHLTETSFGYRLNGPNALILNSSEFDIYGNLVNYTLTFNKVMF